MADRGEAKRTGEFIGDSAEAIVVVDSGVEVEKYRREYVDWGEAWGAVEGPW